MYVAPSSIRIKSPTSNVQRVQHTLFQSALDTPQSISPGLHPLPAKIPPLPAKLCAPHWTIRWGVWLRPGGAREEGRGLTSTRMNCLDCERAPNINQHYYILYYTTLYFTIQIEIERAKHPISTEYFVTCWVHFLISALITLLSQKYILYIVVIYNPISIGAHPPSGILGGKGFSEDSPKATSSTRVSTIGDDLLSYFLVVLILD